MLGRIQSVLLSGRILCLVISLGMCANSLHAQSNDEEIAKKLNNPISSLISLPFQANYDFGIGPSHDGRQFKLNLQPVVPFDVGKDWTLIIRTIVPYISQKDVSKGEITDAPTTPDVMPESFPSHRRRLFAVAAAPPVDRFQDGLGDVSQSFFFSPKRFGPEGVSIGFGPVFGYPTATDDRLGSERWSAGPTGLVLIQRGGWTGGILVSQLWSFAGNEDRADVNATTLQPFLNYTTKARTTFGGNVESVYDWTASQWTVPLNFTISQLIKIGKLPVSLQVGARVYAEKPQGGPEWGLRTAVTFVLPKGR